MNYFAYVCKMTTTDYTKSFDLYKQGVFGFIFKQTKDRELSKEIVQEAYMKLWVNRYKVEVPKIKSWLFTAAYNHMINMLKKENRYVRVGDGKNQRLEDDVTLSETMPDFNRTEIITKELKKLPLTQRRLITLRDIHGYSYEEIGERMNLTPSQVKVYLFRVRKVLKDKFKSLNR